MTILYDPAEKPKRVGPMPVWHHGSKHDCRWTHYRNGNGQLRFIFAHPAGGEAYVAHVFNGYFDRLRTDEFPSFANMRYAVAGRAA